MSVSALSRVAAGPVMIQPRRSIGGLYPDIVVEEQHEDALEITEHPVEQGAAVNDHAFKKPESVVIRGGVSNSSANASSDTSARDFYEKLLELQKKREPFDIVTGKRKHKNMLIESLSEVTSSATENSLLFTAACREVIIVATQVSSVPPAKQHAKPAKTAATSDKGQQQAQATQPKRQSALKAAAG